VDKGHFSSISPESPYRKHTGGKMFSFFRRSTIGVPVLVLAILLLVTQAAVGSPRIVNGSDLQSAILANSQAREANLAAVKDFLSSQVGQRALAIAGTEYQKVERAAALLSDEELARLAAQSQQVQQDFAAGQLTQTHITYIIIAAVAIVLIIALAAA
jgi:hypothetical protein